jgi:hypothetical protein
MYNRFRLFGHYQHERLRGAFFYFDWDMTLDVDLVSLTYHFHLTAAVEGE